MKGYEFFCCTIFYNLSHIIKGYGDKTLPEPTAVSSIPNEEELVVLIQTELD